MNDESHPAPGKSVFLAASIEAGSLKADVRIRNMSESGAVIEGAVLPMADAPIVLRRVEIEIGGAVVWSKAGRCGISFDGVVYVDEWIAGKRLAKTNASLGQRRVDAIQSAIRLGQPLGIFDEQGETPSSPDQSSSRDGLQVRIGEEIAAVQRLLVTLADELSDDPLMIVRHANQLQSIQGVSEVLYHLARVLQSPNPATEAANVTLQALRARLLKLSFF